MLTTMRARVRRMVFDGIASPTKRRPKNYGGGGAIIGQCAAQGGAFSNRGKAAERTVDVLWNPIGALLKHFSPHNGRIFLPLQDKSRFNAVFARRASFLGPAETQRVPCWLVITHLGNAVSK